MKTGTMYGRKVQFHRTLITIDNTLAYTCTLHAHPYQTAMSWCQYKGTYGQSEIRPDTATTM